MNLLASTASAALLLSTVVACGPATPAPEAAPVAAPSSEPAAPVATTEPAPEPAAPAKPALKTYDLAEYQLPFTIELSEAASHKKLSDAMAKAGFVGAIVEDDAANVRIGVSSVPAKLRTLPAMKADLKASYKATFLKEESDLLVYDQTNGAPEKEFGFTLRLEVGGKVFRCTSYVAKADTVEKLDASIAACKALKPAQ